MTEREHYVRSKLLEWTWMLHHFKVPVLCRAFSHLRRESIESPCF